MERVGGERSKTGGSSDGGSSERLSALDPAGPSSPPVLVPGSGTPGRRPSSVSDSGDTGVGTYSSDSIEDVCTYSQRSSTAQPHSLGQLFVPGLSSPVHIRPLSLTCSYDRLSAKHRNTAQWYKSCQQLTSSQSPGSPVNLDNQEPIRKCSSLNKLSSWTVFDSSRTTSYNSDLQGSLDRGLLKSHKRDTCNNRTDFYLPLTSSFRCNSSLLRSPGSGPSYHYKHIQKSTSLESDLSLLRNHSAFSSPIKHNLYTSPTLQDRNMVHEDGNVYGQGLNEQPPLDSPIQPEIRTQMWLSEQMAYRPKFELGGSVGVNAYKETVENYGDKVTRQHGNTPHKAGVKQILKAGPVPVPGLVKFQEGLLRQREQEIDWQKQQILQLQARITENELRVQQVLQSHRGRLEDHYICSSKDKALGLPFKHASDSPCDTELSPKLTAAEMEIVYLKNVFKQVTQKYTEDVCKMEEKIQTRDRYISSLRKKCMRESEQKREKLQRAETLESYLADLPALNEVQVQTQQLKEVQQKAKEMEKTVSWLQRSQEQGHLLLREKYIKIELQTKRENELIASVHSLQQKVQQCLEDGVRLPVLDLKQLEGEKAQLLAQKDYSSKQQQKEEVLLAKPWSLSEMPQVSQLLKELSVCVQDLQALCSILAQRAQGQEPNLSLLLGIKSLSLSAEENNCTALLEEEMRIKLLEVAQLRRDIEELRTNMTQPSVLH